MGISEDYLAAIRKLPPVIQERPPSPPPSEKMSVSDPLGSDGTRPSLRSEGESEKDGLGGPDEGSIAEKEGMAGGEKGVEIGNGVEGGGEKGRGFFSPEIVEKELRSLSASAQRADEVVDDGYL